MSVRRPVSRIWACRIALRPSRRDLSGKVWVRGSVKGGPQRARTRTTRAVGVARNSAARECASPEIREDAPHFITTLMSCYNLYVRSAETLGFGVAVCEGSSCLSPGGRRVSVAGVTFNRLHCSRSFSGSPTAGAITAQLKSLNTFLLGEAARVGVERQTQNKYG
jgi:hypothetical protein